MHDRRIEDTTYTFGNYGALWMNAMTWWDHETNSIWTQPWGRALDGQLKGTILRQIPSQIVPWSSWLAAHPDTLALDWDPGARRFFQDSTDRFVLGVSLAEHSVGFPYPVAAAEGVINASVGPFPVLVHTDSETRVSNIFLRTLNDGTVLTFADREGRLVDDQTGTIWEPNLGLAIEGSLMGEALRSIPYTSSYDWAWLDFYPETAFYIGQDVYLTDEQLRGYP